MSLPPRLEYLLVMLTMVRVPVKSLYLGSAEEASRKVYASRCTKPVITPDPADFLSPACASALSCTPPNETRGRHVGHRAHRDRTRGRLHAVRALARGARPIIVNAAAIAYPGLVLGVGAAPTPLPLAGDAADGVL